MSFDSIAFLSCFLPLILLIYWLIPGTKVKNWVLLALGLVFYCFGSFSGLFLLLGCAVVNYVLGLLIQKGIAPKILCRLGVAGNLLFLFVYKYLDFLLRSVLGLPQLALGLIAPVGISFFVFKSISYLVDLYRDKDKAAPHFPAFLLYLSFFPQVMAGPISRFCDFAPQLENRRFDAASVAAGCRRFVAGLGKKVILCGTVAVAADKVFGLDAGVLDIRLAWVGAVSYMLQIYFDFSGYSDMAIGMGKMLGFETCENFNYPYIAPSIGDFWRRWHMSLSGWFKDYLYIPLGGSRKGAARAGLNKAIVFTLCGLWHGTGFTYLLWGLWHGLFSALASVRFIDPKAMGKTRSGRIFSHVYTLLVVCVGFVMFRATSVTQGFQILGAMFAGFRICPAGTIALHQILSGKFLILSAVSIILAMPVKNWIIGQPKLARFAEPASYIACIGLYALCLAALASGGFAPFIYFQF